jgi:hypothetical protein
LPEDQAFISVYGRLSGWLRVQDKKVTLCGDG